MKMHSVELERKLRLPDPSKAMEGIWKLLRRTRQQLGAAESKHVDLGGPSAATLAVRKQAKVEAERQKARGLYYAQRTAFR